MLLVVIALLLIATYFILGLTATLVGLGFMLSFFMGGVCVLAAMKAKVKEEQAARKIDLNTTNTWKAPV